MRLITGRFGRRSRGDGDAFWRIVYANSHSRGRQPAGDFSGERVPTFAHGARLDPASQARPTPGVADSFTLEKFLQWQIAGKLSRKTLQAGARALAGRGREAL